MADLEAAFKRALQADVRLDMVIMLEVLHDELPWNMILTSGSDYVAVHRDLDRILGLQCDKTEGL